MIPRMKPYGMVLLALVTILFIGSSLSSPAASAAPVEVELVNDHFPPLDREDLITSFDPDGRCGGLTGLVGTWTIGATFVHNNEGDTDTLSGLFFDVSVLTGAGNVLCNADGGPGGVGSTLTVAIPRVSDYSDGLLGPGESFDVEFVIGMPVRAPFSFFVDAFGVVDSPVEN